MRSNQEQPQRHRGAENARIKYTEGLTADTRRWTRIKIFYQSIVHWVVIVGMCFGIGSTCAADFNVAAAISLKGALEQAKPELERVAGGKISFNYGASGTLAAQIRQGMPVDLFISADKATMNGLVDAKLVDAKTVALLAGNQLVLVIPNTPRSGVVIHGFGDLLLPSIQHIAIGEPKTVPAGA